MKRHLVLVGLPGSGKSTVGSIVAELLEVVLWDIDAAVEQRTHMSINDIFSTRGEEQFRELERQEVERALDQEPAVIVPGGGWAAQPGNLEAARDRGLTVYLETSVESASARAAPEKNRPLLGGEGLLERMRGLLAARRPFYERCDRRVMTDGRTAEEVAREVTALAREVPD